MEILFEDDWILVIDKPAGQHTQGTAQGDAGSVIAEAEESFGRQIRIVHRLDRDASGLLVLAKNKRVAGMLGRALAEHLIYREYRAVVGVPLQLQSKGCIEKALKWSGGRCWVDPNGSSAKTNYEVIGRTGARSELAVTLETGRMHQIRVHLAATLGPIEGDRKYGGAPADKLALRVLNGDCVLAAKEVSNEVTRGHSHPLHDFCDIDFL